MSSTAWLTLMNVSQKIRLILMSPDESRLAKTRQDIQLASHLWGPHSTSGKPNHMRSIPRTWFLNNSFICHKYSLRQDVFMMHIKFDIHRSCKRLNPWSLRAYIRRTCLAHLIARASDTRVSNRVPTCTFHINLCSEKLSNTFPSHWILSVF